MAAKLRDLAEALKAAKTRLRPIEWRTGIAYRSKLAESWDGEGFPPTVIAHHAILERVARQACGCWAWIVKRTGRRDEFKGNPRFTDPDWTHHAEKVPGTRRENKWRQAEPHHRMDAFAAWAKNLPGHASDLPSPSNHGDTWLWALRRVATWLDTPEPAPSAGAAEKPAEVEKSTPAPNEKPEAAAEAVIKQLANEIGVKPNRLPLFTYFYANRNGSLRAAADFAKCSPTTAGTWRKKWAKVLGEPRLSKDSIADRQQRARGRGALYAPDDPRHTRQ